jgi:hypothetical protein
MTGRRSLVEGLKSTPEPDAADKARESDFVYGQKARPPQGTATAATTIHRVPLGTRIREDFSKALKRASLERQLNGLEPNTLQDILEEAIEPWLRSNGYIT